MAHSSFSLPALKITRHSKTSRSVSYVPRTLPGHPLMPEAGSQSASHVMTDEDYDDTSSGFDPVVLHDTLSVEEPTEYELEQKAAIAGWEKIRESLKRAFIEGSGLPIGQMCIVCREVSASLRCQQCGTKGFFCWECFETFHKFNNIFLVVEKWETDHFVVVERTIDHPDVRTSHLCSSSKKVPINCVDEYGRTHKIQFLCCDCEPLAVTLSRAKLWPATPSNPRLAFSYEMLDLAEALLLECQVSLKDFSNTLKFRSLLLKGREFYSCLFDQLFEEYRYLKHQCRHLNFIDVNLDVGNVCPACPQENGKTVLAMDALFGLPRKKSAGLSHRNPFYNDFFLSQSHVDEFVAVYQNPKESVSTDCNDFVAGSMIRSSTRYRSLDETAVFGYCCRHEFPGKFINLKHGESKPMQTCLSCLDVRAYIIVGSQSSRNNRLFMMYDIACSLFKHLKSLGRQDILEQLELCLPTFHCYGHKVSCQVNYGPHRCVGIGLSDGETMERLWSYLRRFSRMTKEMRPSHRSDILSSALWFYALKTKLRLARLLVTRYQRAIKTKAITEEVLEQNSNVTSGDIEKWLSEESTNCHFRSRRTKPLLWQTKYFHTLSVYYSLKSQVILERNDGNTSGQLTWIEAQLKEWEMKYSITRWKPSDTTYKELEYSLLLDKKEQLLLEIWKGAQRRLFLLKLKQKYADGQKIAKRLSVQVSRENKMIRSLLEDYSACLSSDETFERIEFREAIDPRALENILQSQGLPCDGSVNTDKRDVIDAYLMLRRSEEEITMLKDDINNTVTYYEKIRDLTIINIEGIVTFEDNHYNRGLTSLLHTQMKTARWLLLQAQNAKEAMSCEHYDQYSSDSDSCPSDSEDEL